MLKITGLDASNISAFRSYLANQNTAQKYIDLSKTTLPTGVMDSCLQWCRTVTAVPNIPEGVTSMRNFCDHGSGGGTSGSALAGPSIITIPSTVRDIWKCFFNCSALHDVDIVIKAETLAETLEETLDRCKNAFSGVGSNVTVWVPNPTLQNAIITAGGNDGVEVKVGTGPNDP